MTFIRHLATITLSYKASKAYLGYQGPTTVRTIPTFYFFSKSKKGTNSVKMEGTVMVHVFVCFTVQCGEEHSCKISMDSSKQFMPKI